MDERRVGRSVRALRQRSGWRQSDLAHRAGVSQPVVSRVETGRWDDLRWSVLRRVCTAAGLRLELDGRWRGGELARLLDAAHAAIQDRLKRRLEAAGWLVAAEVTYSRYGERGSVDLLAWHPATATLLVVEVKSTIADVQGLLRPLDAKVRLARGIARELGWTARDVVPCLAVADSSTVRRRIAEHPALFARFALRGRATAAWLRRPASAPTGLLILLNPPSIRGGNGRRVARVRIRISAPDASVSGPASSAQSAVDRAQHSAGE